MEYKLSNPVDGSNKIVVYRDSSLGKGATATVYRATINGGNYAAKIYHDKSKLNTKKIEAMIANPPDNLTGETAGVVYPRYSWPLSIIEDDSGNSVGYVMPLIDLQESFTLDHYYDKNLGKKLNSPDEVALSYKLEIAANLSRLISHLHSHGHYFIDFKPQNIRVFKRTHAVTLIDCDGFSIKSPAGQIYPAELLSTDYISPEAFRGHKSASELSEDQDRYALATIIFQLLNGGIHPFQGITTGQISVPTNDEKAAQGLYPHGVVSDPRIQARPQSIHNCLDDSTRTLFDKAFMGLPTHRPSATEWANHLDGLLKNKMLTRCEQHPYDIRHMKFMGKDCPECQLQKIQVAKPVKQKTSVKLPPISNDSYSSPIPSATSSEMDPGIKALFVGIGLVVLLGFLVMMFSSINTSSSNKSSATSANPPGARANAANKTFRQQVIATQERERSGNLKTSYATGSYHLNSTNAGNALPDSIPLSTSVAADMEKTNVWFIENNIFNILVTNTSQSNVNAMILSVYDSCSNRSNPEYITMVLGNNFKSGQERLFKVKLPMRGGGDLDRKKCIDVSYAYTSPPPPPNGYASVYLDEKSPAFSWATGYETQASADSAAKASCAKRGALGTCTRMVYGPYKCVAIYRDKVGGWVHTAAGDTASEAESKARASCEKSAGRLCTLADQGSSCAQ